LAEILVATKDGAGKGLERVGPFDKAAGRDTWFILASFE